jgi:hypothetical protein
MRSAGECTYVDVRGSTGYIHLASHERCSVADFASMDDMKNAIRKLDGTDFRGKRVGIKEVWSTG